MREPGLLGALAVAFVVVGILMLVLRWANSGNRVSLLSRPIRRGPPEEYGLLVPVAAPASAAEGERLRAQLAAGGVPGTVAETEAGWRVLVWPGDAARARELLRDQPS